VAGVLSRDPSQDPHDPDPAPEPEPEDEVKPYIVSAGERRWVIAADLAFKVEVSKSAATALTNSGNYQKITGFDSQTIANIPDITVRN
jgi:hypothetical protein